MASGLYRLGKNQIKVVKTLLEKSVSLTFDKIVNELGKDANRWSAKRSLKLLEDNGIVIFLGEEKIKLTKKGEEIVKKIMSQDIVISTHEWDGIWRLISYDIPIEFKKERDYLRGKLKELGFIKVHDSLWVFPYECKEELAIFCHYLRISPFVIFMGANSLPNQNKFIKKFNL